MADCCSGGIKLLYACSGAADVGRLADLVARKLRDDGYARMTCLAGVGADLSGYIASAKGSDENITIDGCAQACARKGLERIGATSRSIVLSDFGCEKGKTTVTENLVSDIASRIKSESASNKETNPSGGCGGNC